MSSEKRVHQPPPRARAWKLRTQTLALGARPLLMGIVNVTPDSFSDGGRFLNHEAAAAHAIRLLDDGADILDIGGESTRPYSAPVSSEEELARVLPVIEAVHRERPEAVLSVDTSKGPVAAAAIQAGAEIINDVRGFAEREGPVGTPGPAGQISAALSGDSGSELLTTLEVARTSGAGICVMHMLGTPQTMQDNPFYDDVVEDVYSYLCQRRDALRAAGIDGERICLDPGIGFGKTHEHNLTLMSNAWRFHELGCPLLVGHSRKGFIGKLIQAAATPAGQIGNRAEASARVWGTIGGALALARQGIQLIRVHDVREVREALLLFEACGGLP